MTPLPYRVGFLAMPEFSYFGLVAAIQPLFLANWLAGRPLFEWQTLSADGGPVRASNGTSVPVDAAMAAAGPFRTVFVLACFDPKKQARDARVTGWLRRTARFGVEIGGIETGSEVLAAAGLLDNHVAAVHWDNLEGFQERYPDVLARSQLFSLERGRPTCAGGTSVIDMMLALVARESDETLAREVAQQMIVGRPREATASQLATAIQPADGSNAAVQSAIALMNEQIEEPLSAEEIAERVGLSQRQLRRQFQRWTGTTLMRGYIMIRLSKAHQLLQQTELSVTEVAVSAGFASLEHFSRVYRSVFGRAPSTDRRQSITAPVYRQPGRRAAAAA
ncbi:MAG TPA: GlxA family transcriptional regulator [Stellaceae bacterium]|nr:GlxA family transcriptional regulator [Stellaceae bacterium]